MAVAMTMFGHGVAERRDDAHGQHEQREGHDGVGDAADDAVGPAAEEAGGDAGKPAHQEHQRDRGDGDEEVEPRRHDHPAEDVAAELVGAEPVRGRRRLSAPPRCCWPADRRARCRARTAPPATISTNSPKAKPVTGFSPHDIADMHRSRRPGRLRRGRWRASPAATSRHASILTRGSIRP